MDNQTSKPIDNCYTCWPILDTDTGKHIIKCVNTVNAKKVVETYMNPNDDIGFSLMAHNAKIICFSNCSIIRKFEEYKLLKNYSNNDYKFSEIQYEDINKHSFTG